MGSHAKLYLGAILAAGTVFFVHAMASWNCQHLLPYLCLLGVALLASTLKVFLPGIPGTLSVSFVFVLLCMLNFSYPETILLACLCAVVSPCGAPSVARSPFACFSNWPTLELRFGWGTRCTG